MRGGGGGGGGVGGAGADGGGEQGERGQVQHVVCRHDFLDSPVGGGGGGGGAPAVAERASRSFYQTPWADVMWILSLVGACGDCVS